MLRGIPLDRGLSVLAQQLHALSLPDRVVAEHREAVAHDELGDPLVGLLGLGLVAVAAGDHHGGEGSFAVGEI